MMSGAALIVEDDPAVLESTALLLESFGFEVKQADRASMALEMLHANPDISLLLTDVVMPDAMDGLELASRAVRANPGLRVLVVSGYPRANFEKTQPSNSAIKWLAKPYGLSQLREALSDLLPA